MTLLESAEGRMNIEIISCLHRGRIELTTPGSAVRHIFAARHVSDWAWQPGDDSPSGWFDLQVWILINWFCRPPILGTLANSVDTDQTPQSAANDQQLHSLWDFHFHSKKYAPLNWKQTSSIITRQSEWQLNPPPQNGGTLGIPGKMEQYQICDPQLWP